MAIEKVIDIFGGEATLIQGMPLVSGHLTASIIGRDKTAWSQVFTYDPVSRIMDTDGSKLRSAVLNYGTGLGSALSVLIFLADMIVGVVNFLVSIVRGILGSFVGFGLMGILLILLLTLISLMISLYAFLAMAPLLILSFILRQIKESRLRGVEEQISNHAFTLFAEVCAAGAAPALSPQS